MIEMAKAVKFIPILAAVGAVVGAYFYGISAGESNQRVACLEAQAQAVQAALDEYEATRKQRVKIVREYVQAEAEIKHQIQYINKTVTEYVKTRDDSACVLDDRGVQLVNDIVAVANADN